MIKNTIVLNTNTDILVVPALKTYATLGVLFCNYGAADESVTLYAVPSGDTAQDKTTIVKSFLIPSGNTLPFDFKLILEAGDKIIAIGSAGSLVAATPTYVEL